jgi:hypothetical protein
VIPAARLFSIFLIVIRFRPIGHAQYGANSRTTTKLIPFIGRVSLLQKNQKKIKMNEIDF